MYEVFRSTQLYAKAGTVVDVTFAKEHIGKMMVIVLNETKLWLKKTNLRIKILAKICFPLLCNEKSISN